MNKLAIIKIERGDWENGFPVSLKIGDDGSSLVFYSARDGNLPGKPDMVEEYEKWRSLYFNLPKTLRLEPPPEQTTNSSETIDKCREAAQKLSKSFNNWLDSAEFKPIIKELRSKLNIGDNIRVVIQTDDLELRRLPWHSWDLFNDYKYAEVALSAADFQNVTEANQSTTKKQLKILAILGNSEGIDVEKDRGFLATLPNAKVEFLVEPERTKITTNLWEQNWDILFFAGHSNTEKETGVIYYNKTEKMSLSELKGGLKTAIQGGLKLAIFNSCKGLGLAQDLEKLDLPQAIVMREPIPDVVAHNFLKYFLREFSGGKSLYMAVRNARERLHDDWENRLPGASWLPTICQNLAAKPLLWQPLNRDILKPLLLGIAAAVLASVIWVFYNPATAYKTYEEERYQISLRYPANWEVKRKDAIMKDITWSAGSFEDFLFITVHPVKPGISLEEYIENEFYPISETNQYLINYVDYRIAGLDGRKIFYQSSSTKVLIKEQYLTIKNNNAYVITYTLEVGKESPELAKEVEKIIDSFRINN